MTSGLGMVHPSTNCRGGGRSFGSPFGAPAFTHATMVSIWACVSERLFANFSVCPSSNHGGMARSSTMACLAMLLHNGRDIFRKSHFGGIRGAVRRVRVLRLLLRMTCHTRHLTPHQRCHAQVQSED